MDKEGVEYLDETEKLRGYKATSREFDKFFQEIVKAGYTLIVISHSTTKQIKENGEKFDKTIPTMSDRGLLVVSRLVDIIGFVDKETDEETGVTSHTLTLRGSKYLEAGSRNPYLPDKLPLSYESLLQAMTDAIDEIEKSGGEVQDTGANPYEDLSEELSYKDLFNSIKICAKAMFSANKKDEYVRIVEEYLGRGRNVKDCTEAQIDQMALILQDLQDFMRENEIENTNLKEKNQDTQEEE